MKLLSAFALLSAATASQAQSNDVMYIGEHFTSCAEIDDPRRNASMTSWLMGYWSGLNSGLVAKVGHTATVDAIVAEVEKTCRAQPTLRLHKATEDVYLRLRREGR